MTSRPTRSAEETTGERGGRFRTRDLALTCFGLVLMQLGWLLALPAFAGMDEFDHVYRAAAVARGDWVSEPADATRGTGAWVNVPSAIVEAAHDECASLAYTVDADCVGTPSPDGTTRVASGAGRYNPLFYALVGYPSLPFDGRAAVYAMRVANMLACTVFFALGLVALRRWARGRWAFAGALLACTPVVVYSSSVVAPNGLEMVAGLAFWCSVLGILRGGSDPPDRVLLTIGALSGSVLLLTRSLGPMWAALIVVTALLATPKPLARVRLLLGSRPFQIALGALVASAVGSLIWIQSMSSLTVGVRDTTHLTTGGKIGKVLELIPLWLFQSVAAFPYRTEPSLPIVYACYFGAALGLVYLGFRHGRAFRPALVVCVLLSTIVPAAITFATLDTFYNAWQGRYGLPYALGLMLLAGAALDSHRPPPGWRLVGPAAVLVAVAVTAATVEVLRLQHFRPSATTGVWDPPPSALIGILVGLGAVLTWTVVAPSRRAAEREDLAVQSRVGD